MSDEEEILSQFKVWGSAQTRLMISAGRVSTAHQRIALEWLAEVDDVLEQARSSFETEQRRTARSAEKAAWIAATAAIIAAIAAIVTIVLMIVK
jgi:hypothetical protein